MPKSHADTPNDFRHSIRSDRTPDREVVESDSPYAKLARLRAENERNGYTREKMKLELLPRLKRMMKEWKVSPFDPTKKTSMMVVDFFVRPLFAKIKS